MLEEIRTFASEQVGVVVSVTMALITAFLVAWYALFGQKRLLRQEHRMSLLRDLMRYWPSRRDPRFITAVFLLDVDFRRKLGIAFRRKRRVEKAQDAYINEASDPDTKEAEEKAVALVRAVGKFLGINIKETAFSDQHRAAAAASLQERSPFKEQVFISESETSANEQEFKPDLSRLPSSPPCKGESPNLKKGV